MTTALPQRHRSVPWVKNGKNVRGEPEERVFTSLYVQINPRLDGCIRGWNLMNQGASGVKEVIQEKKSKHCFVQVEPGSYFPGEGLAHFHINYSEYRRE